jgi:hypothetical protein
MVDSLFSNDNPLRPMTIESQTPLGKSPFTQVAPVPMKNSDLEKKYAPKKAAMGTPPKQPLGETNRPLRARPAGQRKTKRTIATQKREMTEKKPSTILSAISASRGRLG